MFYEHLHPVDGRPLPGVPDHITAEVSAIAENVRVATGCTGFYHEHMRGIQWHVGDTPGGAPCADIMFQGDRYIPVVERDTIERIQRIVNKPRKVKDAEMARAKYAKAAKMYEDQSRRAKDLAPELKDRVAHATRVADNKHSTRVFTVP